MDGDGGLVLDVVAQTCSQMHNHARLFLRGGGHTTAAAGTATARQQTRDTRIDEIKLLSQIC